MELSRKHLVVGGVVLATLLGLCTATWVYYRIRTAAIPHHIQWEIGPVDLSSTEPQEFIFTYMPGEKDPTGLFSLEFRGLPLNSSDWDPPAFEIELAVRDDGRLLGTMQVETEWCNWHKPNAGLVCSPRLGERVYRHELKAGQAYRIEFRMKEPVQVPDGVETVLYGDFVWRKPVSDVR